MAYSNPIFDARRAAEDLRAATRALKDARIAKDRVKALSRTIKAYEDGLAAMRDSLRKAAIRERALRLELASRRDQLSQLLGVLQTLERASAPLLLIHPSGPLGTARAGQILTEITPALVAQAKELRAQVEEIVLLKSLQSTAREDLQQGLKGVQDARLSLTRALGQRTNLPKRFTTDPAKLKTLLENSDTLTGFANGLVDLPFDSTTQTGAISPKSFSDAKGEIPLPVFGTILRRYKEADAAGLRRPGILISAPAVSLVTAPWAATVRYRGPLLDYGNVIILEPEAGYLIVLAGLGQVYGEVGEILAAGDPIGLLSGQEPTTDDFLVEATQGSGKIQLETLYVEIRQNRKTVDPEAWFARQNR
ncbi:MAG: peptidoglycan DD-metalloendopeptidase family protein [Alphaproteobacteria bacterium]|nr:peptidoglycan DD-metalloendopeptidase family protein [Alphaproteobacteria bacterium]